MRPLTRFLLILLLAVTAFAAWSWFRPYEWSPDPAARFEIRQVQLVPDHGYCWLDVFLDRTGATDHDISKEIFLASSKGWRKTAVDFSMAGNESKGTDELWFRFWLDAGDLDGTLKLYLNDGALTVKAGADAPVLDGPRLFLSSHW